MPVGGRVAGKVGIYSSHYNGKGYSGINEEIMWISIGMGITIAVLITIALCYIAREKCRKRNEDTFGNAVLYHKLCREHFGASGNTKNTLPPMVYCSSPQF